MNTPNALHKAIGLFATLLLIFSIIFLALAILGFLGLPAFFGSALYFAYIYTVFVNRAEIEVKFYNPLVQKIANVVPTISSKFQATKSWVKGLFKKAEAAPEAVVA